MVMGLPLVPLQTETTDGIELPQIDPVTIGGFLVVLLVAYVTARLITYALTKASERAVGHRITIRMAIPILKFGIYLGAVYYILGPVLDLSSTQILAFSGLLGAALGFGLKDLFAGMIGGIVIVLERPYRVGDKIDIRDHYGEVVDIGIRATRLVTLDDDLVSVPNYVFFTEAVANANAGKPEMMVVNDFYVSPDSDIERAVEIVEDAVVTSRYVYISDESPFSVSVRDRPYYRLIRARAYVNDHRNELAMKSDVTERVLKEFEREGIEKPRGIEVHDREEESLS